MRPSLALPLFLAIASAPVASAAADDSEESLRYPRRTDPSVSGGERLGDDDLPDDFDGYPTDGRDPGDAYFDTTSEYRSYTPNWTGSFVGGGLIGGAMLQDATFFREPVSSGLYGAFLQMASTQLVLDGELSYTRTSTSAEVEGDAVRIERQTIALAGLAHPFFLGNIRGGWFAFVVPGIYGTAGVSWNWASLRGASHDADVSENGWHIGAGLDLPIDSPNDGGAFWAGMQVRYARITDNREVVWLRDGLFSEQQLLFKLSYRYNGNIIVRKSGPDRL